MDPFLFTSILGGAGLGIMALGGVGARHGGAHGHASHGHAGHGHAAHGHAAHGHASHSHVIRGAARAGGVHAGSFASRYLLPWMSPRAWFSALLGFGAVGLVARNNFGSAIAWPIAIAGGLVFEMFLMRPAWNFFQRFGSEPALTLESTLYDEARAATAFDAQGCGLVALEVDGQVVQLLGTLAAVDREAGTRVRAGDRVRVEAVDAERNRCTVSYIG